MKKQFLALLLTICSSTGYAQLNVTINWYYGRPDAPGDTIHYNEKRKLTWKDFKGKPDQGSMAAAITESGFGYRMSVQSINRHATLAITIFCYFNKNRSWVKHEMDTEYALTHEQHHFDITYINTCRFAKKLKEAPLTITNYSGMIDSIYDACYESLRKMQDQYDGQTSNGRIRNAQFNWNKKVDEMLKDLVTD